MKRKNTHLFLTAAVVAFAYVSSSTLCAQSAPATYKAKCLGCHGADGKGSTGVGKALGVHDFNSPDVTKATTTDLTAIVTNGKNKMPAYGKSLKEAEIKDLVAYVQELGKQK